jgi:hypothetical protein
MVTSEARDKHAGTKRWIKKWCRELKPEEVDWDRASDPSKRYNCMGFVCGPVNGKLRWWQPPQRGEGDVILNPGDYWPDVPERDDLDGFVGAAGAVGFKLCDDDDREWREGHDTIAIYCRDNEQKPFVHAALCLPNGRYMSKMAEHSDFEHLVDAFDDVVVWVPVRRVYMRRLKV